MKPSRKYFGWIITAMAIAVSVQLEAQTESNPSSISQLRVARVDQQAATSGVSTNLPTLEEVRSRALWSAIDSIIRDYHYYVTPDQLEKLLSIKITDREYSKDGHIVSRYEGKVVNNERVRNQKGEVSTLSLQLDNFTPSSYISLWKKLQGWHKGTWFSVLNISDLYSCKPLGAVEEELKSLGMVKGAELIKFSGSGIKSRLIFIEPVYNEEVVLYYENPVEIEPCVDSIRIMGFGHLKVKWHGRSGGVKK